MNFICKVLCPGGSLAIGLLSAAPAMAGFPLSTEDTGTRGQGRGKVEVVLEYGRDDSAGERERAGLMEVAMAYGLRDNLDISFSQPYRRVRIEPAVGEGVVREGVGDTQLSLKWRFFERDTMSVGLKAKLDLPSGDESQKLGQGKVGERLNVFTSRSLGAWEWHIDLGYRHNRNVHGQRRNLWHLSSGVERKLSDLLTVVADIGVESNKNPASDDRLAFSTMGFSWRWSDQWKLEGGAKFGLTPPETDITWLLGMNRRF